MLDEKGRLFGKINIIDLLVVLLVLVVAAVVAIKLLGGGDGLPGAEGTSTHLTYTVEVDGVKPEVYENLKGYVEQEGGDQLMASGDMLNAYVTGVTAAPLPGGSGLHHPPAPERCGGPAGPCRSCCGRSSGTCTRT